MNDSRFSFPALLALFAVTALALSGAGLHSQATPMKQFVIIFRQPKQLTEADRQRVTEETRAWAEHQNAEGHKLDPHILAPEGHWIGTDGTSGPVPANDLGPVTALLFFEARDLAQAVEVARTHPAVRHGVSVEVRPWAPPPSPPTDGGATTTRPE